MMQPQPDTLTFIWDHHSARTSRTLLCVALSLFAHALTFVLFQASYPKPKSQPGPAAQISTLDWSLPVSMPASNGYTTTNANSTSSPPKSSHLPNQKPSSN